MEATKGFALGLGAGPEDRNFDTKVIYDRPFSSAVPYLQGSSSFYEFCSLQ